MANRHGKAPRQASCFLPSRVTLLLRERGIRFASMGEVGRRDTATAPSVKSGHADPITYLERVTIHFAVLRVHVAEAAVPTQGGPFATPGEAF